MSVDVPTVEALTAVVRAAGVVGAGGAGFPLAAKLGARRWRRLIVNAGQSEPLLSKDWAVLAQNAPCVLDGARRLRETCGLDKVVVAVREEFAAVLPDLAGAARRAGIALSWLPDLYPLGYERILKERLFGIPLAGSAGDDTLVINAETVRNLSWAVALGRPVTHKMITVAGAVANPVSLQVPVGTSFSACLALAGGATCGRPAVFDGGVLGGRRVDPEAAWVSASTIGYVVVPDDHSTLRTEGGLDARLVERRRTFLEQTVAGRTQRMSAACALFDLEGYRRARPSFRRTPDPAPGERLRIIAPGGAPLQPTVEAGRAVRRGDPVGLAGGGEIPIHASADGVVIAATAHGIELRCGSAEGAA